VLKLLGEETAAFCFVAYVTNIYVLSKRMRVLINGLYSLLLCVVLRLLFSNLLINRIEYSVVRETVKGN
jgi:hypothetical protein